MIKRPLWTAVGLALLLNACSVWRCPETPASKPFLEVNHFSGGDAPVVYSLETYENGLVRLEKVGFRSFCSKAEEARVSEIQSLVDPERFEAMEWSPEAGMDWRMAQILAGEAEVRIVLERTHDELDPLLHALDSLFTDQFGRRYDMPLLEQ